METEETVSALKIIWEKLSTGELLKLTLTEIILIAGVITLVILAFKIVQKAFKVLLILAALVLVFFFLYSKGFLPL